MELNPISDLKNNPFSLSKFEIVVDKICDSVVESQEDYALLYNNEYKPVPLYDNCEDGYDTLENGIEGNITNDMLIHNEIKTHCGEDLIRSYQSDNESF